jgi:histidinol-phosphate aminotransferase
MLNFAKHLAKTIKNPFPGLPVLEAMIGRKIIDRIGSNESFPYKNHPLKGI